MEINRKSLIIILLFILILRSFNIKTSSIILILIFIYFINNSEILNKWSIYKPKILNFNTNDKTVFFETKQTNNINSFNRQLDPLNLTGNRRLN